MSLSKCKWICFKKILLIGNANSGKATLCSYLANSSSERVHKSQTISSTSTISSCAFDALVPQNDDMQSTDDKMYINITVVNYNYFRSYPDKTSFEYSLFFDNDLVIFAADLTDPASLQYVSEFFSLNTNALHLSKFLLLCTKHDLTNDVRITPSAVEQFKNELDKEFPTMNISLTNKKHITPLIEFIADALYNSFEFALSSHLKFQFPITATANAASLDDLKDQHETKALNVFLLGDDGVGKKTFMKRFFNVDESRKDVDVLRTYVKIETTKYRLDVWNMSLDRLNEHMFRKASAFIIMFDLTRKSSFELCNSLYNKIVDVKSSEFKVWMVGNKIDAEQREVQMEMVNDVKYERKIAYAEISALRGINVYDLILTVTLDAYQDNKMGPSSFVIDKHHEPVSNKSNCC